jgi:hypothetical protein
LNPDNARQRLSLLVGLASVASGPDRRRAFPHVEYLLRRRQVNAAQAFELLRMALAWPLKDATVRVVHGHFFSVPNADVPPHVADPYLGRLRLAPLAFRLAPARSPAEAAIAWDDRALAAGPPYSKTAVGGQYKALMEYVGGSVLHAPEEHRHRALADFKGVLEAMPDKLLFFVYSGALGRWDRFSDREVGEFLRDLRESGDPELAFFADHLWVALLVKRHPDHVRESTSEKVAALRTALDGFRSPSGRSVCDYVAGRYESSLDYLDAEIAKILERQSRPGEKHHQPLANPVKLPPETPIEIDADLAIEEITDWPYPTERLASFLTRDVRLEKLDDERDVLWDQETISMLTARDGAPPELRRIYETTPKHRIASNQLLRVRSDGRNLWVASAADGVFLLTPGGKALAVFDEHKGLPPWRTREDEIVALDNSAATLSSSPRADPPVAIKRGAVSNGEGHLELRLSDRFARLLRVLSPTSAITDHQQRAVLTVFPLGPGKCLAMGRFDPRLRTWIALLSYNEETRQADVKVVHTAARMLARDAYRDRLLLAAPENADLVFNVPWTCLYEEPDDPQQRVVILGRSHEGWGGGPIHNVPLAFDVKTSKVTTLAERLPQFARLRGGSAAACYRGSLVAVDQGILEVFLRRPDGKYTYRRVTSERTQNYYLIQLGHSIYSPGLSWYKIDLEALEIWKLTGPADPAQHALRNFAPSANYGVWASRHFRDNPYRIDFDSPVHQSIPPFRYVPKEHAEKHARAVAAIRELGGFVDRSTRCQREPTLSFTRHSPGTVVCLPEEWRGGDEKLSLLDDLYKLTVVYLLGAPVTDRGMRHLAAIEELEELYLVETGVTAEGLKRLNAPRLHTLHLEDRAGGTAFGDEALKPFAGNRRLMRLCLYGPEFTDAGVELLNTMPQLDTLRLLDTAISQEAMDRIQPRRHKEGFLRIRLK